MAENLEQQVDQWAAALIARLDRKERRKLATDIGRQLRRSNLARIRQQVDPDGNPFDPRKPRRNKKGGIRRRRMFMKLATAKHLKVKPSREGVKVGFFGRAARIARVHHEGLEDRVAPEGPTVRFPRRRLLGITRDDRNAITDLLVKQLGDD